MAEEVVLNPATRPEGYSPPSYRDVDKILQVLKRQRQPKIDKIWEIKRARRGEWSDVLQHIPNSFRKMLIEPDVPQVRDMINRVSGLISKNEPIPEVMPPSGNPSDVKKASKEEARLHALRVQIADQQDRDPYSMGIDSQVSTGESWIGVYPDPRRFNYKGYERGKDEDAKEYKTRYGQLMSEGGVPICIDDFDPQTVFPFRTPSRLAMAIIETEHQRLDIELGFGYHPVKGKDGEIIEWVKRGHTLSEPYVAEDARMGGDGRIVDHDHDRGFAPGESSIEGRVQKIVYMDCWSYQCYLDGVLVEQWEHNFGVVPLFPAEGEQTSDRDPLWQSHGIVDPALAIAKQIVMFSAILASNAMQHGFPTPFLKNPQHGLVNTQGDPLVRTVYLGEMNVLGSQEDIVFPYLQAHMMPDFFRYMETLQNAFESSTLSNFGKAIGSDIAGYAIAQIRSMQLSVLAPIYKNATRQWRKIFYFLRHLVKTVFPAGLFLRGAVEENDEGSQYRPIMEYAKGDTTDFAINVHIDEGIQQDEIAERKSALEMKDSGIWSRRRVMERTGVEDPYAEAQEIDTDRRLGSPAADEIILQMASQIASERTNATRQDMSSPFMQAMNQAKEKVIGGETAGNFQNQGTFPQNADNQGVPEGIPMDSLGIPKLPGGVKGVQQTPVGAPG